MKCIAFGFDEDDHMYFRGALNLPSISDDESRCLDHLSCPTRTLIVGEGWNRAQNLEACNRDFN